MNGRPFNLPWAGMHVMLRPNQFFNLGPSFRMHRPMRVRLLGSKVPAYAFHVHVIDLEVCNLSTVTARKSANGNRRGHGRGQNSFHASFIVTKLAIYSFSCRKINLPLVLWYVPYLDGLKVSEPSIVQSGPVI